MSDPHPIRPLPVAVIGYGDELRGDDAVAAQVVRAVASWELPGVRALALPRLTAELADLLADVELTIFIDACPGEADADPRLEPLAPAALGPADAGASDPRGLLALTNALHGRCPRAWLLVIPAASFALGAQLSATGCRGKIIALRLLRDLIPRLPQAAASRAVRG